MRLTTRRETAQDTQELTNIGTNVLVTVSADSPQGHETSGVSLPEGNPQNLFVSYNSQPTTAWPDGTYSHCGWAYSINGGTSWTSRDDHATPLPGWGNLGGGWSYW